MAGGIRYDQRTVLRSSGLKGAVQGDTLLEPLVQGSELVVKFPYTPTINIAHSANYGTYDAPGSVYQPNYYVNLNNPQIDMTATFTAQSENEAKHMVACMQFFQGVLKGDFGEQTRATSSGTPPPVLRLSSYGSHQFRNTPVILRAYNYTLAEDFDYVTVDTPTGSQTVPTNILVSLSFSPQYPPTTVRKEFNINDYRSGRAGGRGFI